MGGAIVAQSAGVPNVMQLVLTSLLSVASGTENEDRGGAFGSWAWVIDGATDIVPEPLTGAASDASWIADQLDTKLGALAADDAVVSLSDVPRMLADAIRPEFDRVASRAPQGPEDYPSAAGLLVRLSGDVLEFVSVGDCSLILDDGQGGQHVIGVEAKAAGDTWVRRAVEAHLAENPDAEAHHIRDYLWPKLRAARTRLNQPGGYGVFSISAPPSESVRSGSFRVASGARALLASDGLLRLVDVFGAYDIPALFDAAWAQGVDSLFTELRGFEQDDAQCVRYPRAKVSDDATGVLLRVTA